MSKTNLISYSEAINQATKQAMELSQDVMVMGQLIDYKSGVFGTTTGLVERFGNQRVRDFPVAESLMTSAALGAAITGKRVLLVHIRIDFMLYSFDAIVNWLSLWRFKSNNESQAPVVIRAIVGRGWGQGPQHSKSFHSWFGNLPGIKVALPATAFDAKGILLESIFGEDPTIIIEHRSLFNLKDYVPKKPYRVKFGKAVIRKVGKDVTVVSLGCMLIETLKAAKILEKEKIQAEVIDPRTLTPLDKETIINSVKKTGRLAVVDPGWQSFGASAEIITSVIEKCSNYLKSSPIRINFPDSHTPMSQNLEKQYYIDEQKILKKIKKIFKDN